MQTQAEVQLGGGGVHRFYAEIQNQLIQSQRAPQLTANPQSLTEGVLTSYETSSFTSSSSSSSRL